MATLDKTEQDTLPTPAHQKLQGLVSGLAMLLIMIGGLWVMIPQFFINLDRLIARHPYVSFNRWDIPFLLATPMLLVLAYGIGLRLVNKATNQRIQRAIKIALFFGLVALCSRFIYGYVGSSYLSDIGYTSCWSLSSPSLMAPTIYVKRPEYCLDNVGHVRKEILKWMDNNASAGQPLNQISTQREADRLLDVWDEENSFQ